MKLSKKVIIIIATVLVLVIGGGVAYATNTPTARADRELKLANKYLQEGKYQEAILAFEKVIQIEPKNIPARLGLGNAYIATKEFAKAEAVLKEVIQIDANNIPAREDLLKVYIKEGNLDSANTILQEMIKIDPKKDVKQFNADLDSAKAISASKVGYDQGVKQMSDKQYLEAINSFQKVIKEDTDRYSDAQKEIGDCKKIYVANSIQSAKDLADANKYDDAIKLLNDVLKIDPNNQDVKALIDQYTQSLAKAKAATTVTTQPTSNNDQIVQINKSIDLIYDYLQFTQATRDWYNQQGRGHITEINPKYNQTVNGISYVVFAQPANLFEYLINPNTYAVYAEGPQDPQNYKSPLVLRGPIQPGQTGKDYMKLPIFYSIR